MVGSSAGTSSGAPGGRRGRGPSQDVGVEELGPAGGRVVRRCGRVGWQARAPFLRRRRDDPAGAQAGGRLPRAPRRDPGHEARSRRVRRLAPAGGLHRHAYRRAAWRVRRAPAYAAPRRRREGPPTASCGAEHEHAGRRERGRQVGQVVVEQDAGQEVRHRLEGARRLDGRAVGGQPRIEYHAPHGAVQSRRRAARPPRRRRARPGTPAAGPRPAGRARSAGRRARPGPVGRRSERRACSRRRPACCPPRAGRAGPGSSRSAG